MYIRDKFFAKKYIKCSKSLMDNISDPDITFNELGESNYYTEYSTFLSNLPSKEERNEIFNSLINKIKNTSKADKYDCILGLSGGLDSSYLALLAKEHGLNPLVVHFDYGWNTEDAIKNIELITKKLNFDLYTYVIDWEMMKDLQRSYYLSSVIDLDIPADHIIFGAIFNIAKKHKIKYILSGSNYQLELILPKSWNYLKTDLVNIKNIHRKFGRRKFKDIPTNGILQQIYYRILGIESIPLLYYTDYNVNEVKDLLFREIGWKDYGEKHFENIFTRFYQGYVLPYKFGIDKRKAHYSNLVFSGQITLHEAEEKLKSEYYTQAQVNSDKEFIAKKLDFTKEEFENILNQPNLSHELYQTDYRLRLIIYKFINILSLGLKKQILREKILRS